MICKDFNYKAWVGFYLKSKLVNTKLLNSMLRNLKINKFIIALSVFLIGCSSNENQFEIANELFVTDVELFDYNSAIKYEATYSGPGFDHRYLLKTIENGDIVIEYYLDGSIYNMYVRKLGNSYKAIYYRFEGALPPDYSDALFKKNIITNLGAGKFRIIYPYPYNSLKTKHYKKIIIDFSNNPLTLEFFKEIKIIE